VYVSGVRWAQQVKNTFVLAPPKNGTDESKVYTVAFTEFGNLKITFGDDETHGTIPTGDVVILYRVGSGTLGNRVIKGAVSGDVFGFIGAIRTIFKVSNVSTSGGFGGADREDIEHIRQIAPSWFKTTERAITKEDYKTLVMKYVSPSYGAVGKVAIIRPQSDVTDLNIDVPLQVPIKDNGDGVYSLGDIVGGVPVPGSYSFKLDVYYPSYMANVILVYVWVPVGIDINGDGVYESVQYLPPSSVPGKIGILSAVKDYLNKGNFVNGQSQGDVGMTVVQSEVLEGVSYAIKVVISSLLIDEKYDKVAVKNSITKSLYDLFGTFVPGLSFRKYLVYKAIGDTPGVTSFVLTVSSVSTGSELGDEKAVKPYELLTLNEVDVSFYTI
jgi:hypothetical protein